MEIASKAIGSNDAEVQATLEGEDHNFRVRLLWCELHGMGWDRSPHDNQVDRGEKMVRSVPGILRTVSKGGYDTMINERKPIAWTEQPAISFAGHAAAREHDSRQHQA